MKYIKLILIVVLAVVLPFAFLRICIQYTALAELSDSILYLNPIYVPVICGFIGVMLYKATSKIFLPNVLFNIFLIFSTYCLTQMIFNAIERSLADALIGLLLFGPVLYSVPISFIAAAIYKHNKNKAEAEVDTNELTDDTKM